MVLWTDISSGLHIEGSVVSWTDVSSHLELLRLLKPVAGLQYDVLQLQTVGKISRNVLHLLESCFQSLYTMTRPGRQHNRLYESLTGFRMLQIL